MTQIQEIELEVTFYADTFRHCQIFVKTELEKQPEHIRRKVVSDYIANLMNDQHPNRAGRWIAERVFRPWSGGEKDEIAIITCRRIKT